MVVANPALQNAETEKNIEWYAVEVGIEIMGAAGPCFLGAGPREVQDDRADQLESVRDDDDERHQLLERELPGPTLLGALGDGLGGAQPEPRADERRDQRPEDEDAQRADLDPDHDDDLPESSESRACVPNDEPGLGDGGCDGEGGIERRDGLIPRRRRGEHEQGGAHDQQRDE